MHCSLIVFHPHRTIDTLTHTRESPLATALEEGELARVRQLAWSVANDSYRTDALFLYPPFVIALASIYVACAIKSTPHEGDITELVREQRQLRDI